MSKQRGPKGKNYTAKPRKKPTTRDIARHIENGRKMWSIRPIMGNILPANAGEAKKDDN